MPDTLAIDPIRTALRKAVKESASPGAVLYIGDLEQEQNLGRGGGRVLVLPGGAT